MRNTVYEGLCTDSMCPLKPQINKSYVQSTQLPWVKRLCDASSWSGEERKNIQYFPQYCNSLVANFYFSSKTSERNKTSETT